MRIEHRIDTLNTTMPHTEAKTSVLHPMIQSKSKNLETVTPQRGYNHAWRCNPIGTRINWHENRLDMGTHVQHSGQSLLALQNLGVSPYDILRHDMRFGGKVSRIDLAIDVYDSGMSFDMLQDAMRGIVTRAKTANSVRNQIGSGWTQYIGSRSSGAMLRIYDKAAEQGDDENDIVRIELELKGPKARAVSVKIVEVMDSGGTPDSVIRAEICSLCDFPEWQVWKRIMSGEMEEATKLGKKETDTKGWLLGTVAPTLAREMLRDDEFAKAFWLTIEQHIAESSKGQKDTE